MQLYNSALRKRSRNLSHCTDKDTNQRNRHLLNVPYLVSGRTKTQVCCNAKANILYLGSSRAPAGRGLEKSEETKLVRKRWVTGLASSPSFHLSVPSRAEMLICEKTFHFWKGRNCIDSLLHFMKQHLLVKLQGFPGGSVVKNLPNNAEDTS